MIKMPLALGLALALIAAPISTNAKSVATAVAERCRLFLDAYARGDETTVLSEIMPDVVAYGGDVGELFQGAAGIRRMMASDHKLWGGSARIGEISDQSLACAPSICTTTFHAPFIAGSRPPIIVRFTLVWRKQAGVWRLAQSSNSTPTVGQSAEALLHRPPD